MTACVVPLSPPGLVLFLGPYLGLLCAPCGLFGLLLASLWCVFAGNSHQSRTRVLFLRNRLSDFPAFWRPGTPKSEAPGAPLGSFGSPWASLVPLLALLWVSLGALFVLLWAPLVTLETSWGAKINEKSIQNSI